MATATAYLKFSFELMSADALSRYNMHVRFKLNGEEIFVHADHQNLQLQFEWR